MAAQSAFSDVLKEGRRLAGYSQEDLAGRAGLSVSAVGSLEQGLRRAPHRETVKALADALGLSGTARSAFEDAAARARGRRNGRVSTGVPVTLTSFVERPETDEIGALLPARRLVTITGSPGTGKTRIAIEVARRASGHFDDTFFVSFMQVRESGLVALQIALSLGIPTEQDDALRGLVQYFKTRHALLVLDNCEHVIDEAASVVENLLRSCPSLTLLVTSREPLSHSAELAYRLPAMTPQEASELFVARVLQADPVWTLNADRATVIASICKDLDGIPLAIELAASRVPSLGLDTLRGRLHGGLALTGGRDLPPRHQTMTATIAWSYDLLTEREARLFRRLSVLMGDFRLDVAEHVGAGDALSEELVADVLSSLVHKSLIEVHPEGTSVQYGYLEPIRAFAFQRLADAGEVDETMLRLIAWLAQKARAIKASSAPETVFEGRSELDNIRSAIRWAEGTADDANIVAVAEIFIGFGRAWYGHSRQGEVRTLGLTLLEHLDDRKSPALIGRIIHKMAPAVTGPELLALAPRGIALLIATGQPDRAAYLHARCAEVESCRGNGAEAQSHLARATALLGTPQLRGTRNGLVVATAGAYVRCMLGDFAGARATLDEMEISSGDPFELEARIVRAEIAFREGDVERAIALSQACASAAGSGHAAHHLEVLAYGNLARYLLAVRDIDASRVALRRSLTLLVSTRDLGFLHVAVSFARYAAALAALSGQAEFAARLLGSCDSADARAGHLTICDPVPLELALAEITVQLPLARVEDLRAAGESADLFALLEDFLAAPVLSMSGARS